MIQLDSKQSEDATAILADAETALRRFLKHAPRLRYNGCAYSLHLAVRETEECLARLRELRMTIFGEPKKS